LPTLYKVIEKYRLACTVVKTVAVNRLWSASREERR